MSGDIAKALGARASKLSALPLQVAHGAPLRLVTTAKCGVKSINRIGRVTFTDERPRDFWSEQGYDWYTGL